MPLRGHAVPWIFRQNNAANLGGGGSVPIVSLDLSDDVKLWALITTGRVTGSLTSLVGLQASFEI